GGGQARLHLPGRGGYGRGARTPRQHRPQDVPRRGRGVLLDATHGAQAHRAVRGRSAIAGSPSIAGATLDHVALAVERWADAWPRYAVDLGGEWASGGQGPGFAPSQLRFANGAKLELIAPHRVEDNDFLRRYLDRHGPGPHHLTYKVADLAGALDAVRDAGFHPVGVDVSDRTWKEAFLHPAEACGVVVQLAQPSGAGWKTPPPHGLP